jgi:hypothetical protein
LLLETRQEALTDQPINGRVKGNVRSPNVEGAAINE